MDTGVLGRRWTARLGLAIAGLTLAACSLPALAEPTPDLLATAISETIAAQITPATVEPSATAAPPTATSAATPTATPAATATAGQAGCTDQARFVADVNFPDNSLLGPGASFTKTWRLRNEGTCTWTGSYALVFASGNALGGAAAVPLGRSVVPGATIDLSIRLVAPATAGTHRGNWLLRNEAGATFGLGASANQPFWVQIVVGATPTAAPNAWRGEYFSNRDLAGLPVLVRNDSSIDFNWGRNAPATQVPADDFSVRWTRRVRFDEGLYRFRLVSDDGGRLFLDNRRLLDQWSDGAAREISVEVYLRAGDYDLRFETYERGGDARAGLRWEAASGWGYPDWRGEYWPDSTFSSRWSLVRNDREINFDWGSGSPASGIPADGFSVRWFRQLDFAPGSYRLTARADDGVRVYVDGTRVIDEWHASGGTIDYTAVVALNGRHLIQVEYYEGGGGAKVNLGWVPLIATPTSTVAPSATSTSTPTATAQVPEPPAATATSTPTSTEAAPATETPTPTATPTATAEPGSTLVFDFVERACGAAWQSAAGNLACPAQDVDAAGYVLEIGEAFLEDGRQIGPLLLTQPNQELDGWIEGTFPAIELQGGEHLRLAVGCLEGRSACAARFSVGYLTEQEQVRNFVNRTEVYDGQLTTAEVDLSFLAGQSVAFVLRVDGASLDSVGSAVWIRARIVR